MGLFTFGLMYIQMVSTYLCAYCSGLTCRLHMQRFGFALPILLVPIVTTVLASLCRPIGVNNGFVWIQNLDMCQRMTPPSDREGWITLGLCIAVYLSYVFVTRHIWYPKLERMAKIERLFSFGHSDPVYSDVSLALKRRQDLAEKEEYKKKIKEMKNPMVYICATMWHEIRQEMIQLCKSLFRTLFHIIFDDAFQTDEKTKQRVVNSYVEQLIEIMPQACSSVSKGSVTLDPVKKITTPYGGRLEWIMPGGTKMEVHLKDKNKIRHKKRWSQIMYMYYLLGHKLLKGYSSADELLREDKQKVNITAPVRPHSSLLNRLPHSVVEEAANTFVMALDGDVDFGPESVRLLIDRMKKNRDVAAVCGRIHPIGQGPMVWYQQFEYSVGHWLQKATENVLGCVLCCPGCFSLFRGLSLMDDNVMRLYAIEPTEAKHYIQYEQGEDRWLCTLLLQQGYKIDYCAGSDAFTYAPETFHDFYIQRRRWSPSTMANVMDLLTSWKTTVKMNNNISTLFMLYQFVLMASSILAPGTVTFMISGSYTAVLGLNPWQSYLLSTLPVLAYVLLCLKAKTETQVAVAAVMSAVYAIVMVIVSIGTVINIVEEDFLTPNVLFLIGLSTIFVITALAHPNELMCLIHGILYYLTVPSTFVFLTVFFLCNLNIVSWGTREAPKKVDPDEEAVAQQATAKKGKIRKFIESLGISSVLEDLRSFIKQTLGRENEKPSPSTPLSRDLESGMSTPAGGLPLSKPKPKTAPRKPKEKVVVIDPDFWKGVTSLEDGTDGELEEKERLFWQKLITKFLLPLKENKEKQEQIAADLISIRNNVVFAYMLLNVMFTLVILQLELKQDILEEKFFIAGKYEPVSVIFLGVFSVLILTQFFSMLVHRWGTFLLLISSTDITYCTNEGLDSTAMALKEIAEMQTGQKDIIYPDGSSEYSGPKDLGECIIESDEEEEEGHDPRSKFEKIVQREHNRRKSIIAITAGELPQTRLNSWVAQTRRDTKTMAVRDLYKQTTSQNYRQQDYYQPNGYGNTSGFSNKNDFQRRYQQNPQISRFNARRSRRESVFATDFDDIPECDYD
ncbi:chitin synthase chs-2 [Patella vulgata]|uniref:chitin synthase chs-2 n=1 Tax=Patella vulgata TaxID=6465 RepID=UPI0024A8E627|nr:chitin synthase chs-2 [Patella vulgata]